MRAPGFVVDVVDWGTALSPTQALARAAVGGWSVVTVACVWGAGGGFSLAIVLVVVLTGVSIARPDSHAGTLLLMLFAAVWARTVDPAVNGWVLATALSLLALHATLALASIAHPSGQLPWASIARVAGQSLIVALMTAGAWLVARWLDETPPGGGEWLVVVGLVAVAGLTAAVWRWGAPAATP